jgi:hypothetical protein
MELLFSGEVLAREIPAGRLLVLERAATAIFDAAVDEVAAAMLQLWHLRRSKSAPTVASS